MVLHWERHRDLDVLANGLNSHRRLTWDYDERISLGAMIIT